MVRSVTCSMGVSLDGYVAGPDGTFDWTAPDEELFRFTTDELLQLGVHLMGRRLYEDMLIWEADDRLPADHPLPLLEFAALWRPLPKVVFSRTLPAVEGSARLATGSLGEEVERLRAAPGEGNIAIGGGTLAAAAAAAGLVDEYRLRVFPVLVGGGTPIFPRTQLRADLELLETRTFASGIHFVHYRVRR